MRIIGIDPGNSESAYVIFDSAAERVLLADKVANDNLLTMIIYPNMFGPPFMHPEHMVIEQIASFGMAVGAEVFETVFWSGRLAQAWSSSSRECYRVKRMAVKMNLCHDSRAKDPNIRAALIDRFGGAAAIGKKKTPGPLYGISGDMWSALAVAVTWADQNMQPTDTFGRMVTA
jgi:hypothetical protein